jgi:hypothetical protein
MRLLEVWVYDGQLNSNADWLARAWSALRFLMLRTLNFSLGLCLSFNLNHLLQ